MIPLIDLARRQGHVAAGLAGGGEPVGRLQQRQRRLDVSGVHLDVARVERGAQVRDALKWASFLNETIELYGELTTRLGLPVGFGAGLFGGEGFGFAEFGALAHRSRHPLSLASPRRIQLFIVPSGTDWRCASSA